MLNEVTLMFTFKTMVANNNWIVLDTETTGLRRPAEICQIAIVCPTRGVLLDTLVKPSHPIPPEATRIHKITNAMVKDAPTWAEVRPNVLAAVAEKDVIVYNVAYDRKLIQWTDEAAGQEKIDYKAKWWCAMEAYAEQYSVGRRPYGRPRWHSLSDAVRQQNLSVANAHNALGDVMMTIALVQKVWSI
jgi:DNA polymerase-3 subunit epsilon